MTFKGSLAVLAKMFPTLFKAGMSQDQFDDAVKQLKSDVDSGGGTLSVEQIEKISSNIENSVNEAVSATIDDVVAKRVTELTSRLVKIENSLASKDEDSFSGVMAQLKADVTQLKSDVDDLSEDVVDENRRKRITHSDDADVFKPFITKDEKTGHMNMKVSSQDLVRKPKTA